MESYYLNAEAIRANWVVEPGDPRQETARWDKSAESYVQKAIPTLETSRTLQLFRDNRMVDRQSEILDVGCGAGRFSLALAPHCKSIVGTDFSPEMIRGANRRKEENGLENVQFRQANWHTLDLRDTGWEHRFDLAFAHMTPAIHSYDTFRKLEAASRNWCYVAKPTRQKNSLLLALTEELHLEGYRVFDYDMMYAYDTLCMDGKTPMVDYESTVWPYRAPVEEAVETYLPKLELRCHLDDRQRREAEAYIRSCAVDGEVQADTDVVISMLYWQI